MKNRRVVLFAVVTLLIFQTSYAANLSEACQSQLTIAGFYTAPVARELCTMNQSGCERRLLQKYVEKTGAARLICTNYDNINIALSMTVFDSGIAAFFTEALRYGTNYSAAKTRCALDKMTVEPITWAQALAKCD